MSIFWIDDKKESMQRIARGLLIELWNLSGKDNKPSIKNEIYILGNMTHLNSESLPSEADEKKFHNNIADIFKKYCDHIDGVNPQRSTFAKKKSLIENVGRFVFKSESSKQDLELYKEFLALCDSEEFQDPESNMRGKETAISQIVKLLNIPTTKPTLVAIDVMLMKGDFDRCSEGKFMVSMELCHLFFSQNIPRILYSTDATEREMMTVWSDTYTKAYPEDKQPKIYLRSDFGEKVRSHTVEEISALYSKSEKDKEIEYIHDGNKIEIK